MDQCGVQCMEADLMDRHTLHEPLDMVDVVYSLAFPPLGTRDYNKFNTIALTNLLEEANEHGTKVFVHLSCLDVYGSSNSIGPNSTPKPTDEYQKGKLAAEKTLDNFGRNHPDMKIRIVRAAKAVGPRDKMITAPLLRMVEEGRIVLPPGSANLISLSHPKDIAQSMLRAANYQGQWEDCLVKSFDSSVENLAKALTEVTSKKTEVKPSGLLTGKTLIRQYVADQVRAGRTIGFQEFWKKISYAPAYTIEKTVQEVLEWYRKEPWAIKDLV